MSISVLISTYNLGKYISIAIRSILRQTISEFEIIIVDDGSEDDTENIIKFNFNDKRIHYFKKQHTGLGDSLNYGLKKCNNKLIARLDADDIAMPYRLEVQLNSFKKNNFDIVSGSYAVFEDKKIKFVLRNPISDYDIKRNLLLHSCIAHSGVTFYNKVILESGGYTKGILEDYELWLRLREKYKFHNLKEILTLVRQRENSISTINLKANSNKHIAIQDRYIYRNLLVNDSLTKVEYKSLSYREFHYGSKKKARYYFRKCFNTKVLFSKLPLLFLISLIPFNFLNFVIDNKTIPKLKYYFNYFKKDHSLARKELLKYND